MQHRTMLRTGMTGVILGDQAPLGGFARHTVKR